MPGFDPVQGLSDKLGIANPLARTVAAVPAQDFEEGFQIQPLNEDAQVIVGAEIKLLGNLMPHTPFSFSGAQRIIKEYYPGNDEPVMQILGAMEDNIKIKGDLKDINYGAESLTTQNRGLSYRVMELIDDLRKRGTLCKFVLGPWQRYGYIENSVFDLERITRLKYELTLNIIGENAPTQDKIIQVDERPDIADAAKILDQVEGFVAQNRPFDNLPNRTIAQFINEQVSFVQSRVNLVTDFVDEVFTSVDNIRQSVNRALGLIGGLQRQIRRYQRELGNIDFFTPGGPVASGYFYLQTANSSIASSVRLSGLLESLRARISSRLAAVPLATYRVVEGDTLQKISARFYGTPDNWRMIQEENDIAAGAVLEANTVLDIPRVS